MYIAEWLADHFDDVSDLPYREDEWADDAENEPDAEELWWARMLAEEGDEQC